MLRAGRAVVETGTDFGEVHKTWVISVIFWFLLHYQGEFPPRRQLITHLEAVSSTKKN
jgi:hypothetical protein